MKKVFADDTHTLTIEYTKNPEEIKKLKILLATDDDGAEAIRQRRVSRKVAFRQYAERVASAYQAALPANKQSVARWLA